MRAISQTSLCLRVVVFMFLLVAWAFGQNVSASKDADDVVMRMMPNGVPTVLIFPEDENQKEQYVQQLHREQASATGKRAQQIAYLLVKLRSDEAENRKFLLGALESCASDSSFTGCDEDTAALAISLYDEGHKEFLSPLLQVGLTSDGALSEVLGDFYAALLAGNPSDFLRRIKEFSETDQTHLCSLAGSRDGGGTSSTELDRITRYLKARGDRSSQTCLRAVEQATQAAGASNNDQCSTPQESITETISDNGVIGLPLHGWIGYTNTGTPVRGMLVECFKDRYKTLLATVFTNEEGRFSFPSLGEGTYYLRATAANVFPIQTAVRVSSTSRAQVCLITEAE